MICIHENQGCVCDSCPGCLKHNVQKLQEENKRLMWAAKEALKFLESFHYDDNRPEGAGRIEELLTHALGGK